MKSNGYGGIAGQVKLRGKKSKALSCGCCDVFNFCEKMEWQEAANEIKYYEEHPEELKTDDGFEQAA